MLNVTLVRVANYSSFVFELWPVVGGYDGRVTENIEYLEELRNYAEELQIPPEDVGLVSMP